MRSSLKYADVVWGGFSESDSNLLDSLQIEGARVVTGALKGTNTVSLLNDLSWVELNVTKRYFNVASPYLCDVCPNFVSELGSSYSLRSANNLCLPFVRTERHKKSSIQEWNSLPFQVSSSAIF